MAHAVGAQVLVGVLQPALYIAVGLLHLRVWLAVGHVHRFIALVGELGGFWVFGGGGVGLQWPLGGGPRHLALGGVYRRLGPGGAGVGWLRVAVWGMGVSLRWVTDLPTRPS